MHVSVACTINLTLWDGIIQVCNLLSCTRDVSGKPMHGGRIFYYWLDVDLQPCLAVSLLKMYERHQ